MKNILLGVAAVLFLFFSGNGAKAYTVDDLGNIEVQGNFDMGPMSVSLTADPGDSFTEEIRVLNRSGKSKEYLVELEDFEGSHQVDQPVSLQGNTSGRFSAKDWVKPEFTHFSLKHGERMTFNVDVAIPAGADIGDHYVSILISTPAEDNDGMSNKDEKKANVAVISRVGSLFFVRVNGETKESGELKSFSADRKWYEKLPVNFSLAFENSGNVRLQPSGSIEIKNQFGTPMETIEIEPFNALRDSLRGMNFAWDKPGFLLGRYTAVLNLKNGYNDTVDTKSISFWIIPWKQLALGACAFIVVILLLVMMKKTFSFNINVKKKKKR
ncbi:MAG: hypothetical protein WC823_06715 [Parcubacteria group bacterium]|jgi:hypothetical protein